MNLNPNSLQRLAGCFVEPSLKDAAPGSRFQFERLGYFSVDPDSTPADAGFQPYGVPGRHVGENPEEGMKKGLGIRDWRSEYRG